jgi:hypothetical protein
MMTKKFLIAGLLTTTAVIALGAAYFGFRRKENTMEQTLAENTNIPPADVPGSGCAVVLDVPPADATATVRTKDTTIPPIDASAPAHTETATFAMG